MHARQNARTHKKGSGHCHRKSNQRQHDSPGAQGIARRQHSHRMQQCCRCKPRHQRGVFYGIPEPPAAPAQFIIGPVTACGDTNCQKNPREQHPWAHCAGKCRANLSGQQCGNGKGKCHREADISDIKRRRMECEADILQQRVQACASGRCRIKPFERVGREKQEGKKTECDQSLRKQCRAQRLMVEPFFEQRYRSSRKRKHRYPQQHRAFMIAPGARQFEDHRLVDMAVRCDQEHR